MYKLNKIAQNDRDNLFNTLDRDFVTSDKRNMQIANRIRRTCFGKPPFNNWSK